MHGKHREGEAERTERISQSMPRALESVGFDIETTGIDAQAIVTVACVWGPDGNQAHCFYGEDPSAVLEILNNAKHIYTFNGMEFDLPRFATHCNMSMEAWSRKTVDPLYTMKHTMGFGACVKLNDVLQENGFETKSGSGLQAIQFWNEGNRDALMSYCMDDARLTYELCAKTDGIKWAKRWVLKLRESRILDFQPFITPQSCA